MTGQAWALLLLKWQLFRNTMNAGRIIGALMSLLIVLVVFVFASGAGIGLYFVGVRITETPDPLFFLMMMDALAFAFMALCMVSFFSELQRQDQFDFRTLLHLPISLPAAYLINFGVSLFSHSLIFVLFGAVGFMLGISQQLGAVVWWGLPLALLFYLMVMSWMYYLRGIVAMLSINKRRRRALVALAPVIMILLFQIPSIVSRNVSKSEAGMRAWAEYAEALGRQWLEPANQLLPPGWMPYAYQQLLFGDIQLALLFTGAMLLLTILGIRLGYKSTVRFYLSGAREESGARGGGKGRTLTAWKLPLLDEDTSAMTGAAFLTYLRHPNIRMMFIMPFVMGGVILLMYHPEVREKFQARWMPMLLLLWPYFNFTMIFFNLFGVDGHGFRGLMLLPTPRYKLLLAKNLALFPFVAGVNLLFVMLGSFVNPFPPMTLLIVIIHIFILFFTLCIPGNFLTLYLPYRIGFDAMRQRGNRPLMFLIGLATPILMSVLFLPTTFCLLVDDFAAPLLPYPGIPFGLIASLLLMAVVGIVYRKSLIYAGDLFVDREPKMLESLIKNLD